MKKNKNIARKKERAMYRKSLNHHKKTETGIQKKKKEFYEFYYIINKNKLMNNEKIGYLQTSQIILINEE